MRTPDLKESLNEFDEALRRYRWYIRKMLGNQMLRPDDRRRQKELEDLVESVLSTVICELGKTCG